MLWNPAGDAKARGLEALDDEVIGTEAGGGAHRLPVLRLEGSRNGHRAIVLDEAVKASQPGEDTEEMVGDGGAGEIADEPCEGGVAIHPLKEANDVFAP